MGCTAGSLRVRGLNSVEFLKQLLQIAKEVLQAEKEIPPEEDEDRGKAALTELFNEVKTAETPIMVERVVANIDEIVRLGRFPGWQDTLAGEREIKKALRKSLFKYKLHATRNCSRKPTAISGNITKRGLIGFEIQHRKLRMSSVTVIPTVPGELFAKFQTSFYSKVLEVE
ncbi:hypothetical protein TPL01_11130 [Sulfuriferula plumbiphila]|uniref:Uncharacterized protein n=1 Tax=Sulfuriferula plumbiphila TaxID=171865 RepID=A0A512L669_9PROT|nr:hypothetical protein SFPGR_09960 [Sulfuriferula plumbiphila]GEP29975.1 hypothetical protein TPL01_11130 [Sulfuriferula plumbiphila]